MKIEFDSEADALYVEFHDGQVYDCLAVTEGVNVDIDEVRRDEKNNEAYLCVNT